MKDYIEERAVEIANYIIETKATVRQTAKKFGISKSTVHKDAGVIIRTVKGSVYSPHMRGWVDALYYAKKRMAESKMDFKKL